MRPPATPWAGDVGSNGTIIVKNGALIAGDVSTSDPGALDIKDINDVLGDTTSTAPEQHLPLVPAEDWVFAEANNDNLTGISGSYTYDPATDAFESTGNVILSSGVYYFLRHSLEEQRPVDAGAGRRGYHLRDR